MYNGEIIIVIINFKNYVFAIAFRIRSNIIVAFILKIISIGHNNVRTKVINIIRKNTFSLVLLNRTTVFWLYYVIYSQ